MPKNTDAITLRITRRELGTILAALRAYQDKHLHGGPETTNPSIEDIATDGGSFKPLGFRAIGKLCEKLNTSENLPATRSLAVEPPHKEGGDEPLYRVIYVIDINAVSPLGAARQAHQIMMDMIRHDSQPPILEILDHSGEVVSVDLSKE